MSYKLSEEEQKRIACIRDYKYAKKMHQSFLEYENVEIGEVYLISYTYGDKIKYICHHGKEQTKFFIIAKDEGFVFAKRISSNGGLGKEVICMTTSYPLGPLDKDYKLQPDPSYVDSLILGEKYNAMAEGKKIKSAKNKARLINNKKIIYFPNPIGARDFVNSLKIGDMLWSADTTYGQKMVGWEVVDIENKPTCQEWEIKKYPWQPNFNIRGSTQEDREHNEQGFENVIKVLLKPVVNPLNTRKSSDFVTFKDFTLERSKYHKWYTDKLVTVEDMLGE